MTREFGLTLSVHMSVRGQREGIEEIADRVAGAAFEAMEINCGDPECEHDQCSKAPLGPTWVNGAYIHETIEELAEESVGE